LLWPFFPVFENKTMTQEHVIIFLCGGVLVKKELATCCHRFLLWWC
jgi:hypothetical protein